MVDKALKIANQFSFSNRTKRDVRVKEEKYHIRSGKLQQWKQEFSADHKAFFKELHGKDLISLGYETDMDW
ncbi:MAG: hypothetical protein ACE5EH_09225 [Gammaproteobacteria bacterium]